MTQYKKMHSFVIFDTIRWIYFLFQSRVLVNFKSISYSIHSFIFYKAFLKNQRSIFAHVSLSPIFRTLLILNNIELLNRSYFLSIKFLMHSYYISCFFCYNIIKLACVIFWREAEILSQNNMPQNIFSIRSFKKILIFSR